MKIYHNPRCSKSRETLKLIQESGQEAEIVEYLKDIPGEDEIKQLLSLLGMEAEDLVRKGEADYKTLWKGKSLSEAEKIQLLATHPKLIERPIVVQGNKAIIGRPPERVKELL
jgi:arsenate reductase